MNVFSKKILTASLGALVIGATVIASATPAAAWGHRYGGGWGGGWRGPALFGGLALGALAAGAAYNSPYYYGGCYIERRPVTNRWGDVIGTRRVRVCD